MSDLLNEDPVGRRAALRRIGRPAAALALAGAGTAGGWLAASAPARATTAPAAAAPSAAASAGRLADALQRPAVRLAQPGRQSMLGLAAAGTRLVAVGERGAVLLSDDGGRVWRQAQDVPVSVTLTAVQFVDARSGWAIGHQGVVLHSSDGGEHWLRQLDGLAAAKLALAELQARPDADPKALAAAERTVADGADKPLLALDFVNAREGWVAGAFGLLLATADGGRSWQSVATRIDNPKGAHVYLLQREGARVLIAGEQGLAALSEDGGQTFRRLSTPYQGSWFTGALLPDGGLLLAGLRGNAQRSTDGGRSWQAVASPMPVSLTATLRDREGRLWLANQAGVLLQAELAADGARLRPHGPSGARQPAALLQTADGALWVAGWTGLHRIVPGKPAP